ncbi:helix-turn-helix domain-containing protein [Kribbella sp. NPDC049227]|uniref:helix-turn-helix domain-containing protein n=1 Tax=Kribbella sp. NPDC049227 TaxID=3364113 RepID=UPI00372252CA
MTEPLIANNLKAERVAAGFATVEELAERAGIDAAWCSYIEDGKVLATREEYQRLLDALGGIPANRIYELTWRQLTLIDQDGPMPSMEWATEMWLGYRDAGHLLMARDELNFYDKQPGLDHQAEVYLNMSCGTQRSPHLLQDTVSVFEALGISFVAAAGPGAACCGKPIAIGKSEESFERHRQSRLDRSQAWGATTQVNWCGACQQTGTAAAARHELADGLVSPVREIQLIPFLEERIRALGDKVPWKQEVRRRVIAEGHPGNSNVHYHAQQVMPRLLSMVPGVQVMGYYDGWWELSPCATFGLEGSRPPAWTERPETPAELDDHRARLAADIRRRGGDTVSTMHFNCHQMWSRYATEGMDVVHAISILAEALDCTHPDRFQDAVQHGDPQRLVEESRPRWQSWGMTEARATQMARSICDQAAGTNYANEGLDDADGQSYAMTRRVNAGSFCGGCGGGGCQTHGNPSRSMASSHNRAS